MPKCLNLIGQKFQRLEVKAFAYIKKGRSYWNCICKCGNFKIVCNRELKTGNTKSCGCLHIGKTNNFKHGMSHTPTYKSWESMHQHCYNPKNHNYFRYGLRGIKVCNKWLNSFENFYKDMGKKPKNFSIDRIDNNGNYTPDNCRWATIYEQNNNMRSNISITIHNETHNIAQWTRIKKFKKTTVYDRIYAGWSPEKAVTTPVK